jgi:hypothetical protein
LTHGTAIAIFAVAHPRIWGTIMPVARQDRPLETLRSEAVDRLIMNYGHGHLSLEAFERRLDQALEAADHAALQALTADLDLDVDAGYIERKKAELNLEYPRRTATSTEHIVNVFSGGGRGGAWIVPEEIRVFTLFGATDLDFSDARFVAGITRLKVLCLFGAVDIFVRDDISTAINTICVFGAIDNDVPATSDPTAPRLEVDGLVLFGAIDAKIKKTLKERLFEFADALRQMFGAAPAAERPTRSRDAFSSRKSR